MIECLQDGTVRLDINLKGALSIWEFVSILRFKVPAFSCDLTSHSLGYSAIASVSTMP